MKITVNLATRPFADLGPIFKRLRISMAVFAVLSIGFGIGLHYLHAKAEVARAKERAIDSQISGINSERQGFQTMMRQPDNAQVLQQANNLNALFDQKAFSWTLAMEDLETVLPGGVQVTTLEPVRDEKSGEITLKLRVVGPRDKGLQLVQNLEHSRHFLHPAITGESIESNAAPGAALEPVSATNRVNFDLNALYNAATISEVPVQKKAEDAPKDEASPAAAAAPKAVVPAAGPGLRRPPFTGVSRPPAVGRPPAGQPSPAVKSPYVRQPQGSVQPGPPVLQSPQAMRQAAQGHFPMGPQRQPGSKPQQTPTPTRPGGPQ